MFKLNNAKLLIGIFLIFSILISGCKIQEDKQIVMGPASDAIIFKELSEEDAVNELKSGSIDYYLSSLTSDQATELKNNPDLDLYYAYSQFTGISLNPAPAEDGQLNPFSLQKVRFALHYLIDRDEIVKSVYGGFAIPIAAPMIPEHPGYGAIKSSIDSYNIQYDEEKAISLINKAMIDAGAEKIDNKWNYNGKRITLSVPIDDENQQSAGIADIVSSKLQEVGFEVNKTYYQRSDEDYENPMYTSDPIELKWHFYVTGWIFYSASKYQEYGFPGLTSKEGWWQYENKEIEDVKEQLKDSSSKQKWEELNSKLTKLQINDAQGIWLISKKNIFAARKLVEGLIEDDNIGMRSFGNIREANIPGKKTLVIGQKYLYEEDASWNPIVIEHIGMMDIVNTIHDPVKWSNPKTLEQNPFRWSYSVERLQDVPEDAFVWNVENKKWNLVGKDITAKTKVSYDLSNYIDTKWHHGQKISWSDILFFVSSTWDRAYDVEKQKISSERWQEYFEPVKGLKITGDILEVYLEKEDFNDENLLDFARMFQRIAPWEIYASSDKLVFGQNGFEYGEEDAPDLEKLSLINKEHITKILAILDSLDYSESKPYTSIDGKAYLTEQEFNARKTALNTWYNKHDHLIVSDGPFYLDRYNKEDGSIELKAFRDESYPFKKGDWIVEQKLEE